MTRTLIEPVSVLRILILLPMGMLRISTFAAALGVMVILAISHLMKTAGDIFDEVRVCVLEEVLPQEPVQVSSWTTKGGETARTVRKQVLAELDGPPRLGEPRCSLRSRSRISFIPRDLPRPTNYYCAWQLYGTRLPGQLWTNHSKSPSPELRARIWTSAHSADETTS